MSRLTKILLIGGGGHCLSCIDVIKSTGKYEIVGIIDNKLELKKTICGVEVIGTDDDIPKFLSKSDEFLITVGQIKSSDVRISLFEKCISLGLTPAKIISPHAYVSPGAVVKMGTIIMHRCVINSMASIGQNCIVNSGSIIEHDVVIGNHCHISTGAICNGAVKIADGVFVGSGSVLIQGVNVGFNAVIGAASLVLRDVPEYAKVAGSPSKEI